MNTVTELAWTQIWQTSAVALVVGAVVWAIGRRRPHLAYLLWLVVILKSLTPPIVSSPTGLFSWAMMTGSVTESLNSRGPTTISNGKAELPVSSESSRAAQKVFSRQEINAAPPMALPQI